VVFGSTRQRVIDGSQEKGLVVFPVDGKKIIKKIEKFDFGYYYIDRGG